MTSRSAADRASLQAKIDQYFWFHSIDFGDGLAARGAKTAEYIAGECEAILGPVNLHGTTLLDIGSYNGFYAFEAKRRGAASVTASDSVVWNNAKRARESFELARSLLKSDVAALEIDPTEITKAAVGVFDVVLYLGVFYHLIDPIACTRGISECAGRLLIIETHLDALAINRPAMIFYPGSELNNSPTNWWGPNHAAVAGMLNTAGFDDVRIVTPTPGAAYRGARAVWHRLKGRNDLAAAFRQDRAVFHARKSPTGDSRRNAPSRGG